MIIRAATPLLAEHGETVTTKQIADAAGIAEGTIFRVFPDKDALIAAAVDAALDQETLEAGIAAIDTELPFRVRLEQAVCILQRQVVDVWRLMSRVGSRFREHPPRRPPDNRALVALLQARDADLRIDAETGARVLFGLTLATTHPMFVDHAMKASEIVALFLDGAEVEAC